MFVPCFTTLAVILVYDFFFSFIDVTEKDLDVLLLTETWLRESCDELGCVVSSSRLDFNLTTKCVIETTRGLDLV